jgi:hypothetical protein
MKQLLFTIGFLVLVATNVLTLTNAAFNTAVSGLLGTALGVRTVSSALHTKMASQKKLIKQRNATALKRKIATRRFGTRLASRTKRLAAKSIAAIPAESIPFIGVGVLIADTGYELYAACESLRDLDQLYVEWDMKTATSDDAMHSVCNPSLPDAEKLLKALTGSNE